MGHSETTADELVDAATSASPPNLTTARRYCLPNFMLATPIRFLTTAIIKPAKYQSLLPLWAAQQPVNITLTL